jgi:hypothetical protein
VVQRLGVAPDHSIWTVGYQFDSETGKLAKQDYSMVRRFTFEGKQAAVSLPRSFVKAAWSELQIEATADRVGVLLCTGSTCANPEWIELDQAGRVLERLRIVNIVEPVQIVFTADDHVYAQGGGRGPLFSFDSASNSMKPVAKPDATLMGADGSSLVYRKTLSPNVDLVWVRQL